MMLTITDVFCCDPNPITVTQVHLLHAYQRFWDTNCRAPFECRRMPRSSSAVWLISEVRNVFVTVVRIFKYMEQCKY